jgi:hypothetical protein
MVEAPPLHFLFLLLLLLKRHLSSLLAVRLVAVQQLLV